MRARMVIDVRRPQHANLVVQPVEPVIGEVLGEEENHPRPRARGLDDVDAKWAEIQKSLR